jgi:hypothetical protein
MVGWEGYVPRSTGGEPEMNVKEFREFLAQFDDDTIVECVFHSSGSGYYDQGGNAYVVEFSPDIKYLIMTGQPYCANSHFDYTDFTGNPHVKPTDERYNKKYLSIGSINN